MEGFVALMGLFLVGTPFAFLFMMIIGKRRKWSSLGFAKFYFRAGIVIIAFILLDTAIAPLFHNKVDAESLSLIVQILLGIFILTVGYAPFSGIAIGLPMSVIGGFNAFLTYRRKDFTAAKYWGYGVILMLVPLGLFFLQSFLLDHSHSFCMWVQGSTQFCGK